MSGTSPEVTVVIPTHDRRDFLRDAIGSVLAQEEVELEVIVVDDASAEAVSAFVDVRDRRLRVIRFEENIGQSAARNAGIAAARGEWVAFLDDDDVWAPRKLRLQLDAAADAGATWVYCGVLLFGDGGSVTRMWGPPDPESLVEQLLVRNVVQAGASTVLARTDRVRAVGGFDPELGTLSDRDLWIRLALDGPAAAVEEPLAGYRRHGSTLIGTTKKRTLQEADVVAERYSQLAREHGVTFDRDHLDKWLTSERIRSLRYAAAASQSQGRTARALRLQADAFARSRSVADARRFAGILLGDRLRGVLRSRSKSTTEREAETAPGWLAPFVSEGHA